MVFEIAVRGGVTLEGERHANSDNPILGGRRTGIFTRIPENGSDMEPKDFLGFLIALGIGLLSGLQRETVKTGVAGIRTFALIALTGYFCGLLAQQWDSFWVVVVGLVCLAVLLATANYVQASKEKSHEVGQTTEVAALLIFLLTSWLPFGHTAIIIVAGGTVALLLYLKEPMQAFAMRLGENDLRAIFQFVAISLVILPVVPDENFGPWGVWNPREIWWMVVLIVGLGLAGYFAHKWLGQRRGTLTAGILGGLISSTATTLSYSRQVRSEKKLALAAAFIIVMASTISIFRVIFEIGVVVPWAVATMVPPLLIPALAMLGLGWWLFRRMGDAEEGQVPEPSNPAELSSAIVFAVLYALIKLAVAYAKEQFGQAGLYVVSIMSGLTDMDAITLSIGNTVQAGQLEAGDAWRYILVASMANMGFKGGIAAVVGGGVLGRRVLYVFGTVALVGVVILLMW